MLPGLLFFSAPGAAAYSIAVLPVADLTQERDGVNFAITTQLVEQLRQQGLEVIEIPQVVEFMVQQRLRRCDEIDSFSARKMATSLKSDSVLLTTLYKQEKTTDQSSMILTLLHGKTGLPVWSKTTSRHLNDTQPLFGVSTNRDLSVLQSRQIHDIVQELMQEQPSLPDISPQDLPQAQIANIQIIPSLVRGGSPIRCRLKINFLDSEPDSVLISGGQQTITLQQTDVPHVYSGTFTSREEEGNQNLNLLLNWSPEKEKNSISLGSYQVANSPVQLHLDFHSSIKLDDIHAFSNSIKIFPRMVPRRPLELWSITMRDEQGETVFSETQYTSLPAEMNWQGINSNRRQLNMGYYTLTLTVRDIAGNEAHTTSKLYLQSTDAKMVSIRQQTKQGRSQLKIQPSEALVIPIDNWRLTLETLKGTPLLTQKGTRLPATITLPAQVSRQELVCHFQIEDKLGNHYSTNVIQRETTSKKGIVAQVQPENDWKADF